MGQDKAWLDWHGESWWQVQLAKLQELQPSRLLLSCRHEQNIATPHAEVLLDPPASDGPLPALARCLETAQMPVLALAVDMPRISTDFLRHLLSISSDPDKGVVYHGRHGYEPLCALYPITILPMLYDAMAHRDLRFQNLVQNAVQAGLLTVLSMTSDQEMLFFNLNTPEDIASL